MDMIDLDTATQHERCACGRVWYQLADETWGLVARVGKSVPPTTSASVATYVVKREGFEEREYFEAERHSDPRPHLAQHARAAYLYSHPLDGALLPACGPALAEVLRDARQAQLVPFLDASGALLVGRRGTGETPRDLARLLTEYAELVAAHLAGDSVVCVTTNCAEPADRLAIPARPVCPSHAAALVRDDVIPSIDVDYPARREPSETEADRDRLANQEIRVRSAEIREAAQGRRSGRRR